jgi:RNA polymerase sigma-B factor
LTTTSLALSSHNAAARTRNVRFRPDACCDPLTRRIARAHSTGERAERNALVLQFMPFARRIAHKYSTPRHREDVEQVAYLALVKAVDRFDPAHGNAFVTFAGPTIAGEIKNYLRDHSWDVHVPRRLQDRALRARRVRTELTAELGREPRIDEIAARLDADASSVLEALAAAQARDTASLDRTVERDGAPGPTFADLVTHGADDLGFARVIDRAALRDALGRLSDQERQALGLRVIYELPQSEIAARMGVSQMQVSRLVRRATQHLNRAVTDSASAVHV